MQFGQQKLGLQQYKNEGLYNYYTGKQNQLNQTLTSALTAAGSLASAGIGAAGQAGSFGKLFKK
jgi:L-arabinose isomerase